MDNNNCPISQNGFEKVKKTRKNLHYVEKKQKKIKILCREVM